MNNLQDMAGQALQMFGILALELSLLFLLISFLVGVLQAYIPPTKIQSLLSSDNGRGFILAGFLGAITPFCSCSTIPFLKGLLQARASFGTMMVFLFASPLLNPIIIGLFVVTFGAGVAFFYFLMALVVAILGGYLLERLGFERYVKAEAYQRSTLSPCQAGEEPACGDASKGQKSINLAVVWHNSWSDFKSVLPYLLAGIFIGSLIYGFMPGDLIASFAGSDKPWAVPVAAVIGIPLYIRAEAVIPLSSALAAKGMGLGAIMALIIGSAGASLTEVVLLKSIFKNTLIAAFLVVIITMAVVAGYLYGWIF